MREAFLYMSIAVMFSAPAFSQSYESNITYDKKKQKAIAIDYGHSREAVQNALVQKIEKSGHMGKEEKGLFNRDKGFIVFKDAFVMDISDERMDYILKIERKSRKENDEATLYLVINKGGEDAIPNMSAYDVGRAKVFLNNLLPEIEEASLELQIKAHDDAIVKSEKKFKALQDEKAGLEKKLQKNAEDLEIQQKQIENQRGALDGLKGKRRVPVE